MAFHFISTAEKPMQHLSLHDWSARVGRLRNVADARRIDAFAVKNTSRMLRNESRIEGAWANYAANEALDGRIIEVNRWREIVSKTFERLENEILLLEEERKAAEEELEWEQGPIDVIRKMLFTRDGRVETELTHDRPGTEIKNELYVLENNQKMLALRIQNAWEKLRRLEVVRFKIEQEIRNKTETVNIDSEQRSLDRNSPKISYKVDALRNPKGFRSYENWLEHSKNMKHLAENELRDTAAIREALFVCREKARNMLFSQQERTETYIRRRIFDTQQAINELEWQRLRMREDIKDLTCEIQSMEEDLLFKTNALKLAETRLENRSQRCPTELCLDTAHFELCLEVEKVREIRRCLSDKLDESKANFNLLSDHCKKIDADLLKKEHSLKLDKRLLELRIEFKESETGTEPENIFAQTDRNIELTRTEDITQKN